MQIEVTVKIRKVNFLHLILFCLTLKGDINPKELIMKKDEIITVKFEQPSLKDQGKALGLALGFTAIVGGVGYLIGLQYDKAEARRLCKEFIENGSLDEMKEFKRSKWFKLLSKKDQAKFMEAMMSHSKDFEEDEEAKEA